MLTVAQMGVPVSLFEEFRMEGFGFWIWGLGLRVWGLELRVWGSASFSARRHTPCLQYPLDPP